jgi:excisionase family DNA binding protein
MVTAAQYAERVGVHVDTIRRWAREGYGPQPIRIGPRAVRYDADEVDAWLVGKRQVVA